MKHAILGACALALAACSATSTVPVSATTVRTYVAEGQLLCAAGPAALAMFAPSGAAILAKGAAKAAVDAVCGAINSVAVSPSDAPVGAVTVLLPPSVTIPVKP
jgi:hypothetical protein